MELATRLYNVKEVWEFYKIDKNKLAMFRQLGMINYIKIGRQYLYTDVDLNTFIDTYKNCDLTDVSSCMRAKNRLNIKY